MKISSSSLQGLGPLGPFPRLIHMSKLITPMDAQNTKIYFIIQVKEGCSAKPLLFDLYCRHCKTMEMQQQYRHKKGTLTTLMFADDEVVISETEGM
jgi:hypothetical protein